MIRDFLENMKYEFNYFFIRDEIFFRNMVLETGIRSDGRSVNDFRPIKIKVDVYKKLHGSALFQRGQTQVYASIISFQLVFSILRFFTKI